MSRDDLHTRFGKQIRPRRHVVNTTVEEGLACCVDSQREAVVLMMALFITSMTVELSAAARVECVEDGQVVSCTGLIVHLPVDALDAFVEACRIAGVNEEWKLRSLRIDSNMWSGNRMLLCLWDSHNQVRKVEIDVRTRELLRYLDTSRRGCDGILTVRQATEAEAVASAHEYLTTLSGLSAELRLTSVLERDGGWSIDFERVLDGYRVKQDFVRIMVNPRSACVYSFVKRWTPELCAPSLTLNQRDAVARLAALGNDVRGTSVTSELMWVTADTASDLGLLAWVIGSPSGEWWVSSSDGALIGRAIDLVQYEGQSVNTDVTNDEPGNPFYDTMAYVYDIMYEELPSANFINLPTHSQWIAASTSYVFFSVGHGSTVGTHNRIEVSRPNNYLEFVYSENITNAPLRYLVYLLHCYSGWSSSGYEEDSVAHQFLYNSKHTEIEGRVSYQCAIVGFDDTVDAYEGAGFTEVFWDALADGDTVLQAFYDADSQYSDVGDVCVILGNTGITLDG